MCDINLKIRVHQSMHIYLKHILPYFIPIRFETVEP